MINILILGIGGNVSQGILKAIRMCNIETHIVGACISPYSSGLYMCDEALISPFANDGHFIKWVIDTSNKYQIDIIFTGVEENIIVLEKNIAQIRKETNAIFVASDYEMLKIGQNKYDTCRWLKENGCNYPRFARLDDSKEFNDLVGNCGFPLIAKPVNGKSATGLIIVENEQQLKAIYGLKNYVLEEYLPDGLEYTVGCYCDKEGELRKIIIMQRILRKGTTVYSKVVNDNDIEREATLICKRFKPRGPLNIQMRKNKAGQPVAFELNVRFSGSTAMRSNFGFRDVEAMIKEYVLKQDISSCFNIIYGESFRYDNEFYLFHNQVSDMKDKQMIKNHDTFYDTSLSDGK